MDKISIKFHFQLHEIQIYSHLCSMDHILLQFTLWDLSIGGYPKTLNDKGLYAE